MLASTPARAVRPWPKRALQRGRGWRKRNGTVPFLFFGITTRARLALFHAGGPFGAPDLAGELLAAMKEIYRLTGFTFDPDPRSMAVAELAGNALEAAGIDPAAALRGDL